MNRVLDKSERRAGGAEARPVSTAAPAAEDSTGPVALLDDAADLREQWRGIQGRFVDDPQRAVHEANRLVDRTLDEIRANVERQPPGEQMSTDELRMSFRRYREFFQRLLAA